MLLLTNSDNISTDKVPYLIERLMVAGAKNVHVVPALTKKGRPEYLFFIDVDADKISVIKEMMATETGTLGIRVLKDEHLAMDFEIKEIHLEIHSEDGLPLFKGNVHVKLVKDKNNKLLTARAEYEEIKAIAGSLYANQAGLTFDELKQIIELEILKKMRNYTYSIEIL